MIVIMMMMRVVKINLNHGETLAKANTEVRPAKSQNWKKEPGIRNNEEDDDNDKSELSLVQYYNDNNEDRKG